LVVVTLRPGSGRDIDVLYVLPLEVRVFVVPDLSPLREIRNSYYVVGFDESTASLLVVQTVQAPYNLLAFLAIRQIVYLLHLTHCLADVLDFSKLRRKQMFIDEKPNRYLYIIIVFS